MHQYVIIAAGVTVFLKYVQNVVLALFMGWDSVQSVLKKW